MHPAAPEDEINSFYEDLQKAQTEFENSDRLITMGDLNSKIGTKCDGEDDVMGNNGYGFRNERGERLICFARSNEMFIANTMFKKRNNKRKQNTLKSI